jgi:hypothetical protein
MSAPSINTTAARDALAWATEEQPEDHADKPIWLWFWEAIEGDFNDERSVGQLAMDAGISMIPLVDQLCDIRDLVANCRKISNEPKDQWAWLSLAFTLVGLFPSLGSLVKGVLKILWVFFRRYGVDKALGPAMTWVITFLRRRDVQRYLRALQVDEVFGWLSKQVRQLAAKVDPAALLAAFDKGLGLLASWASKVEFLPRMAARAQKSLEMLRSVRKMADAPLAHAVAPIQKVLDNFALRLEREALMARRGVVNAHNVHFWGTLPDAHAVTLMRREDPPPSWLLKGVMKNGEDAKRFLTKPAYQSAVAAGWPALTEKNVESFVAGAIKAEEIKGPSRIYRVLSPSSRAMSDCWISEAVFKRVDAQGDPRTFWRKNLAVWPQWNSDGQFVVYDIPAGESLKVWRGAASAQMLNDVPRRYLLGGEEQIIFNVPRGHASNDTMRYYQLGDGRGNQLHKPIGQAEYDALSQAEKDQYVAVRENINHPNISGPFETGWATTEYDAALPQRIGLPSLPGQTTTLAKPPAR